MRSSAILFVFAGLVSTATHFALPLLEEDPFHSTLVLLPLVLAALTALDRAAPRRAERTKLNFAPSFAGRTEAVMLIFLVAAILTRHSFGLAATDWFLAAGLLLLLAHRVARLLLAWRPALGRSLPASPPAAFFWLPLTVYIALQPWMAEHRQVDGDEPYYLLVAHSLAYDFDSELSDNYARRDARRFLEREAPLAPQEGDPRGSSGEIYSRHNLLLPLVLAPAYRLAGRTGAMALMALMTAALAWMVLRLAARYAPASAASGRPTAALLAYAIFAFAPPLLIYSYQIWIEVPAALLLCLVADRLRDFSERRPAPREWLILALLLALLPLLKLRLGLVALPALALAVWRGRPSRRSLALVGGGLGLALLALLGHNQWRFGHPLKIHRWSELALANTPAEEFARGAIGMFWDVAFGLFPSAPVWLLILPALVHLARRRDPLLTDLVILSPLYLVTLAPRFEWYGGWSPPFRYPLIFLPFFALALVPLFEHRYRGGLRALCAALGSATLVLTVVWVVVPGWTYSFADGSTHLLDAASTRLGADLVSFSPSTVRPRTATWIWVVLSLATIPLALAPWRVRRGAVEAGLAALFLLAVALPLLAKSLPTRTVELEDAWLEHQRGGEFPGPWTPQRPRYRAGWEIPPSGRVSIPVVPGGAEVSLRLMTLGTTRDQAAELVVIAGTAELDRLIVEPGDWQWLEIGPYAWPTGAPLVLMVDGEPGSGRVGIDRVELEWR